MGFFSAPDLVPWLPFIVNILSVRASFQLTGRGFKKEKMARRVGGGGGDYLREAIILKISGVGGDYSR